MDTEHTEPECDTQWRLKRSSDSEESERKRKEHKNIDGLSENLLPPESKEIRAGAILALETYKGDLTETQWFWKNDYHDSWFPLPAQILAFVQKDSTTIFRFGIYIHQHPGGPYGHDTYDYILDPVKLVMWRENDTYLGEKRHCLILKKVIGDCEMIGVRPEIFEEHNNLENVMNFRPNEFPANPPPAEQDYDPKNIETCYFSIQDDEYVPYPPQIQFALNNSQEQVYFSIYDREYWPELFGGSYRQYIVDPVKLLQISVSWKKVRGVVTLQPDEKVAIPIVKMTAVSGKVDIGKPNPLEYGLIYKLPENYKSSRQVRIFYQKEMSFMNTIQYCPQIGNPFYVLYICELQVKNPREYMKSIIGKCQAANRDHTITGAIMIPDQDNPQIVVQYFEGPIRKAKQLQKNIKLDNVVTTFLVLGEGFLGTNDREFKGWDMKEEASHDETRNVIYEYFDRDIKTNTRQHSEAMIKVLGRLQKLRQSYVMGESEV